MEWLAFVPAATLVAAVPGANQMLGLRNTVVHGARRTLLSLAGRLGVFAVMATLTALGLGRLLATSQVAFEVLRWLGVGYLAFLGARSLRRAGRRSPDAPAPGGEARSSAAALARREALVAAANPKALLLFTAFVPQFLAVGADPTVAMLLGGAAYIAIEGAVACGYVLAGATLRRGAVGVDVGRWADAVAGVVFTGLAGALVVTPRRS